MHNIINVTVGLMKSAKVFDDNINNSISLCYQDLKLHLQGLLASFHLLIISYSELGTLVVSSVE